MSVHSRPRVTALGLGSRGRAYQVASLPFQLASPAVSALMGDAVAGPLIAKTFARITPVRDVDVRGVTIKCFLPLHQHGALYHSINMASREPETLDWIDSFENGSVFYDVGSGFGSESLYASLKFPSLQIYAFDCDCIASYNFAANIDLNKTKNIVNYLCAIDADQTPIIVAQWAKYYFAGKDDPPI